MTVFESNTHQGLEKKKPDIPFWLRLLWSVLWGGVDFTLQFLGVFSTKIKQLHQARIPDLEFLEKVKILRNEKKRSAVFFCSSAGEYEQAMPLIEKLEQRLDCFVYIFFFSPSGLSFARSRDEKRQHSLAYLDRPLYWQCAFASMSPDLVFVVRHELWPSFIQTAYQVSSLYLLNASVHGSITAHSGLRKFVKKNLLPFFRKIFVVSQEDQQLYGDIYKIDSDRFRVSGDTKYERALQRASRTAERNPQVINKIRNLFGEKPLLIIGSAWEMDYQLCIKAYQIRKTQNLAKSGLIIALHEPAKDPVEKLQNFCSQNGLSSQLYSCLDSEKIDSQDFDVLIVDCLGVLAEVYKCGTWAWVGGALHHQVHNVLEPTFQGLSIAFGPKFRNSHEAVKLVNAGLAKVFSHPEQVAQWWRDAEQAKSVGKTTLAYLKPLAGASERVFNEISEHVLQ